jgi:predicted MFS family arabinose efflux permease
MGPRGLFFLNALPALMGVIMILSLRENKNSGGKSSNGEPHYAPILKETRFWSPSLTVFLTGLLFGYVISFLSLFLKQHSISVSYFFISFSLCLFISRFFMMRVLQKFRPFFLSSAGITLMTLSYTTLFFFASPLFTVISGIFLGLGFSVIYPVLSVHMTKCFSSEKQPAALALFNFFFQSGIYLTPLMGGFFIAKFGMKFFLGFLVGLGILGILITLFVKIRYTQKLKKH